MRVTTFLIFFAAALFAAATPAQAQDLEILTRPDAIHVERMDGNITPMERVFFHVIVHNVSPAPVTVEWLRFDLINSTGVLLSGQYSGPALTGLFDSAIDRRRIEPTPQQTLDIAPDQRKAVSDIFFDCPLGFIGESVVVEVQYKAGGKSNSQKVSAPLTRMPGFSGRLPFDGVWYVAAEHGYLDAHKRFQSEAYAYDFLQVGLNGKSYLRDGSRNSDYLAYGKKVLASSDGVIAAVRSDIVENQPGTPNVNTPGGNIVIINHGNGQFGYYAHLKPGSVSVKVGATVHAGDPIGEVGNSGDSTEPQIHFHVMNGSDPAQADGIPLVFANWKAQAYGRSPELRESGLLPRGEFVQP